MRALALVVLALAASTVADAARLPGVKTPSRNIACFYVPVRPTAHGNLLCDIHRASYLRSVQRQCEERAGLDWHGFTLPSAGGATLVCAGGIMYDVGRDTPAYRVLAYGTTWRYRGFTCRSRSTGLTCTNARGHGLFLSRESYRLW